MVCAFVDQESAHCDWESVQCLPESNWCDISHGSLSVSDRVCCVQVIKSWWDKETVKRYRERAQCIGKFYHSYKEKGQHIKGVTQAVEPGSSCVFMSFTLGSGQCLRSATQAVKAGNAFVCLPFSLEMACTNFDQGLDSSGACVCVRRSSWKRLFVYVTLHHWITLLHYGSL